MRRNEWVRGVCAKPQVRCRECPNQAFIPLGDDILRSHLAGKASGNAADFTVGVYPMLPDETCWFLAADFDKKSWMLGCCGIPGRDAGKRRACRHRTIALGQRWHAWIFFAEPVPAAAARRLGALLVTATSGNGVRGTESLQTPRWRGQSGANSSRRPARLHPLKAVSPQVE